MQTASSLALDIWSNHKINCAIARDDVIVVHCLIVHVCMYA